MFRPGPGNVYCCDLITSGTELSYQNSVQFSHICFQSIFIELDKPPSSIEYFSELNWLCALVAHLFASFPLKLSCYEYSNDLSWVGWSFPQRHINVSHRQLGKLTFRRCVPPQWTNQSLRRQTANQRGYSARRLNCSYFGLLGWNFWYINNVVDDPSVDYYK